MQQRSTVRGIRRHKQVSGWLFLILLTALLLLTAGYAPQLNAQSFSEAGQDQSHPAALEVDDPALYLPAISWNEALDTSHFGRYWRYDGSSTCIECHATEAEEMHSSVHYQWQGDTPHVADMDQGGKLGGINDFCGYPDINFISQMTNLDGETVDGGCAGCHTGMGERPETVATTEQLGNIDCLICHSDAYQRKVDAVDGGFRFVPAPERMTVEELVAITNVHLPSDDSCIDCHAYAGGGENNKRGDIEAAHRNPPSKEFDVHMASQALDGAGLGCLDCHTAEDHRIAGRGSDLRPTDLDTPVRCTNCHEEQPHDDDELDRHTARVDCASCHIPTFARIQSTDMVRDFRETEVVEAKQLYEPKITRQASVTPVYRFFNGDSTFYQYDSPYDLGERGRVVMSEPLGGVTQGGAKIFPFKLHRAFQAYDLSTDKLIPVKMGVLFQTGDADAAILSGASNVGWPLDDGYDFVETERFMGIFHEVAPADDALRCDDCHSNNSRLEYDALGYTPRTHREGELLCASCHEDESDEWDADEFFEKVHDKHLEYGEDDAVSASSENIDCIECHIFSAAR